MSHKMKSGTVPAVSAQIQTSYMYIMFIFYMQYM